MTFGTEEWRPVDGYPYEVSSLGRVRRTGKGQGAKVGRILKGRVSENGYQFVTLHIHPGVNETRYIHDIVCEIFHGPKPSPVHEVAHGDGVRLNCKDGNLRWATRKENMEDAIRHDTIRRGSEHYNAKLDDISIRRIRELASSGVSHGKISMQFNVKRQAISRIMAGKTWTHVQ